MRHQLKQPVQSVHLAETINRSLTPQQPLWQGSPPPGVDAILTRDALAKHFRDGYVSWASNFALLRADYVTDNFQPEAARIRAQRASHTTLQRLWRSLAGLPCVCAISRVVATRSRLEVTRGARVPCNEQRSCFPAFRTGPCVG